MRRLLNLLNCTSILIDLGTGELDFVCFLKIFGYIFLSRTEEFLKGKNQRLNSYIYCL